MKVEIQTIEDGRLEWIAVMQTSDDKFAVEWGHALLKGFTGRMARLAPKLRVVDLHGRVVGAWQSEGYEMAASPEETGTPTP